MMGAQFKFIHCSDLHLDTPFKRISFYSRELGDRMVESAFQALDAVVDKAIEEKVDFIIFSGDIFDIEFSTPRSRMRFAEAIERAKVRCYIGYGNHDFERKWEKSIPFPSNAVVFPEHAVNIPYPDEENKLTDVIGISHSVKEEGRDLTRDIRGTDAFSIAVVHCDVDTASEGRRYAPCRLDDLLNKNIDYWALGHIHKRAILYESPYVVYPGNTQGRSSKETGAKGAYLVTVNNNKVTDLEFFRTGPILWTDVTADIADKDMNGLVDNISKNSVPGSFLKLSITGHGDLDHTVRLEQESFIDIVERRTGCKVASLDIGSVPQIDINERRRTGDFTSALISEADQIMKMSRDELIALICSTKASLSIRGMFEDMDDQELRQMVYDAQISLLERMTGAGI